jgi:hypothetical protein
LSEGSRARRITSIRGSSWWISVQGLIVGKLAVVDVIAPQLDRLVRCVEGRLGVLGAPATVGMAVNEPRDSCSAETADQVGVCVAGGEETQGGQLVELAVELFARPTLKRYVSRRGGRVVIDRAKVHAEEHLDGKLLLSSSDEALSAPDMARLYKSLLEVEAAWRDLKQVLALRPISHRRRTGFGRT